MKKQTTLFTLLITLLIIAGCASSAMPLAISTQNDIVKQTGHYKPGDDTPPVVLSSDPETGAEIAPDGSVEIRFSQPMNQASVEAAFSIRPGDSTDGTFDWPDEQTMLFTMTDNFKRGQAYRISISEKALSAAGQPLNRSFELRFNAAGFLEVTSNQPADGDIEIMTDAIVTVAFNRPVVLLSGVGQVAKVSEILAFEPPVDGQGEWLNTSIYQFTPDDEFKPATEYTVRVLGGLSDTLGQGTLEDDFEWRFTTITPAAIGSLPASGDIYVSPTPVISLTFNQPMNRKDVEQNLALVNEATGDSVVLTNFEWSNTGLTLPHDEDEYGYYDYDPGAGPEAIGVETVAFSSTKSLELETNYRLELPKGTAGKLTKTQTGNDFVATFTTITAPAVVTTEPADGEDFPEYIWSGNVQFSSPINPESLKFGKNLIIEYSLDGETIIAITPTEVFSYWYDNNTSFQFNYPAQLNSSYTMTIGADIAGRYGQPLGKKTIVHWKTLNKTPAVRFLSPRIGFYNAYNPTRLYLTMRNLSRANFRLSRISPDDFISLTSGNWYDTWQTYRPEKADLVREWSMDDEQDAEAHKNYVYELPLTKESSDSLEPGIYYLEGLPAEKAIYSDADQAGFDNSEAKVLLVVSQYNIIFKQSDGTALAWVTDLQSGQGVAGLPVVFSGKGYESEWQEIGQATTDADGVAFIEHDGIGDNYGTYFAFVGTDKNSNFVVGLNEWDEGINRYDFNGVTVEDWKQKVTGYLYTDRNIYRPGQTVYFKAILRTDDDAAYGLPPVGDTVEVILRDAQYNDVYKENLPINDMGTIDGSFKLDETAPLGYYSMNANYGEDAYLSYDFNVAAYRKPEFEVEVTTNLAEYAQNETIKAIANVAYFSGGPIAEANVSWNVLSDNYQFVYQGDYDFSDIDPRWPSYYYETFGEHIASGEGVTDKQGRFTFELPADIANKRNSQKFTLELSVTGLNDQEISNQTTAIVHKGEFYVGLRPVRYVTTAGDPANVELIVVDWQSKPVANQKVELIFSEQQWYSVQSQDPEQARTGRSDDSFYWQNLVDTVAVHTTTVTTDKQGRAKASFTPEKGGSYKVYARARDKDDRQIFSSTYLWVSGGRYINWGQANDDRIELVADKREYNVGDTAKLLIPHPYSETVQALVTLERGHIYEHFVTTLKTNSDQIEIPITENMTPNMYVSVALVDGSGPLPDVKVSTKRKLPSFKVGYVNLPINPASKELEITLTPNDEFYQPGDKASFNVKVTNQGKPVEAELSLALIDKAVLTLAPEKTGQLMDIFWHERGIGVRTGSPLTLAIDRVNLVIDAKKGGGGGDGGLQGNDTVREAFADVPLWKATFRTDKNGEGTVEATLPDNLTSWVLIGKGATGADTLVGESQVEIVSTKPLIVRPVLPRFLVMGDELSMGMIIQNNSADDLTVIPNFTAEGLTLNDPDFATRKIPAGKEIRIEYALSVPLATDETVKVTMSAKADKLQDAVTLELPIYSFSSPETVATSGVLSEDGTKTEVIFLPDQIDPTQGDLVVAIDPSLAANMVDGLEYLENYPYQSVDATVSRFLPNLLTYRAYQQLGLNKPKPEQLIRTSIQRLYSWQNVDGGWGWFSNSESNPYLTAYVLLGLVEAQKAEFNISQTAIDRAVEYLDGTLEAPKDVVEAWEANQQAFVLYVMAEAERGDFSRASALFGQREQLDMFGRAFLAMAMNLEDPTASQIDTLLTDINSAAISSATGTHWEESQVDFYSMNTDTRSTAIIITALARLQPDSPLLPQAIRWLMSVRQSGHWETTQETAWAIIGLTDWLIVSEDIVADYQWTVSLNGKQLKEGQVNQTNLETTKLQLKVAELVDDDVNQLSINRGRKGQQSTAGNLYYAAYLTYFKPADTVSALNRGVSVSRQYRIQGDEDTLINQAVVGDVIEVKLTLVVPDDLHYVRVEDPLPAGAEGIDSSLATTSILNQGPELVRTDRTNAWGDNHWFAHTELRDEKAVLFASYLPRGTYEYTYQIRASIPGEFRVKPTQAQQVYFPESFGRGDGEIFMILR